MSIKEAYTAQELVPALGYKNARNVRDRATRENWTPRPRVGRGGGQEWLVSSMPDVTRTAIMAAVAQETTAPALQSASASVLATQTGQTLLPAIPAAPEDAVVPDWSRDLALARFRIVTEWRASTARANARGFSTKTATETFVTGYNAGVLLPALSREQVKDVSAPTLYRWDGLLRKHHNDMMILADRRGKWMRGGAAGLGQIGPEAEQLFLKAYLQDNKPSMSVAYRAVCEALEVRALPVPSYTGVRRFFERFDAAHHDITVFMREGDKALADKVGPFMTRDDKVLQVGDVLISDGHRMNFMMVNPETGKPARFTLIGWQDWASRMFVSFEIMLEENTQAIASSFHRAVVMLGKKPGAVLIDNGKAYKNNYFEAETDTSELDGLYLRLGVSVKHSAPYVARTKIVERWWGDFDRQAAVIIDSYVGACIDDKPAHLMRNEKWHRDRQSGWVPDLEAVKRMVTDYAMWKATQPHPTRPNTTPWEVFSAGRGPGFSEDERAALARDFMYRRKATPRRCRITMMGITFESDALYGINKELTAYYSFSDLSEIYIYDDGHFVTVARPVESVHPLADLYGSALDVQNVKKRNREIAQKRTDTRKLAAAIGGAGADVLLNAPYMRGLAERRQAILYSSPALEPSSVQTVPALDAAQVAPAMPEAESRAIAALVESRRLKASAPDYTLPPFFGSELERYDCLFKLHYEEGISLRPEDVAFMGKYEASDEWPVTGRRYEQLRRALYANVQHLEQTA